MYENPWKFNGKIFDSENIGDFEGFVYLIRNKNTSERYIGRKYFYNRRKPTKDARRKKTESDWKKYYGSSKKLLTDVEKYGIMVFERHILSLHLTRGDVNFEEVRQQFLLNVLEDSGWYNDAIGKWRRTSERIVDGRVFANTEIGSLF